MSCDIMLLSFIGWDWAILIVSLRLVVVVQEI